MANGLASLFPPGMDTFMAARQMREQSERGQMQQATGLMGLLNSVRQQQQEQRFRSELQAAGNDENAQLDVAARYMGPDALGKMIQGSQDRRLTSDNTKQVALSNLSQRIQRDAADIAHKLRTATTEEEKFHWKQQMDVLRATAQQQAAEIQAGRYRYDTGGIVQTPFPAAPTPAPQGGLAAPLSPRWQSALEGRPPAEQSALRMAMQGEAGNQRVTADAGEYDPSRQVPWVPPGAPAPAPAQRVVAPQPTPVVGGVNPGGLDGPLADSRTTQQAVAVPTANIVQPAAAPAAPEMPKFGGSPREQAAARNRWLLQQSNAQNSNVKAPDTIVQAIVDGRMQMPTGFALRSPYWQDVIARVSQQDPSFDASRYGARAAARRTFASGPEARNVTALNTVIGHLGTLDEAVTAIQNQDIRVANLVVNRLSVEMGRPEVTNFETARLAVAEEVMRVFRQVGASEIEARQWGRTINSSGSPAQLRGNIQTLGKLLDSRVDAIGQQFERTVNQTGNPARVDPANRAVLDRFIKGGTSTPGDQGRRATDSLPPTNARGWRLMTDKNGRKAYVGPNNEIEEVR